MNTNMDVSEAGECLSPHLPLRQAGAVRLEWLPASGDQRVRVVEWTCACRAVVYELCISGGQGFRRRTVQTQPRHEVSETHRMPAEQARRLWRDLLTGAAR